MKPRLVDFNLFTLLIAISTSSILVNGLYVSSRIQCEYRDRNGDSLILNCTLVTGQVSSQPALNSDQSPSSSILINNIDLSGGQSPSSSSSLNIKVGMDKWWRTPWEGLNINYNIIRTLIWSNSKLAELGEFAFKDLNFLQKLDLSGNRLQHIQMHVFRAFELDLVDLDLSQNMFQFVPEKIFLNKRLESLEILRLNENPVQIVTAGSFENLRNLKLLELNYCQIKSIETGAFDNLKQLESLSLIGNHLRYLNENTFRPFNLRSFYVHENPLICDCNLRWLLEFIKNVDYQQQIYESQLTLTIPSLSSSSPHLNRYSQRDNNSPDSQQKVLTVAAAAQDYLKCDQPNSLKSQANFLDINPDSFMCDIRLDFHESLNESMYEIGDEALLVCNVYGDPEPDVYWSFGQKPIEKGLRDDELNKYAVTEIYSTRKTNKTSELRIRSLELSDFGYYFCTAEIRGSSNRKTIRFHLKRLNQIIGARSPLAGLSNMYDIVVASMESAVLSLSNNLLNNRQISNTTLLVLFSVFISLFLFLAFLCLFACWRFNCCCCCFGSSKAKRKKQRMLLDIDDTKEEKHLLPNGMVSGANGTLPNRTRPGQNSAGFDDRDHSHANHHHNNNNTVNSNHYTSLANDSSATLISNPHQHQKLSNSIRMAYPNNNDIYANHSLLTTTSSTTASYIPSQTNQHPQQIAIDTTNQTPRYHLLPNGAAEAYYDDVKYAGHGHSHHMDDPNNLYSNSPYRMQPNQQQYSPLIRRDDPTIPLYATLKPKHHVHHPQQQQQPQSKNNSYLQYSNTISRGSTNQTPPLPQPRRYQQSQNYLLNLPPPPPPPPAMPPLKPKRTFEYAHNSNNQRDLYSDSGALLLGGSDGTATTTTTTSTTAEFDQQQLMQSPEYLLQTQPVASNLKIEQLKSQYRVVGGGSTTSLEEDLDLNDLKDFEDVTFDNLRKPEHLQHRHHHNHSHQPDYGKKVMKTVMSKLSTDHGKNSEQSLLLRSSSSSEKSNSDNTINRCELLPPPPPEPPIESLAQEKCGEAKLEQIIVDQKQADASKIYEETEI